MDAAATTTPLSQTDPSPLTSPAQHADEAPPSVDSSLRIVVNGARLVEPATGVGRYIEAILHHWNRWLAPEQVVVMLPRALEPQRLSEVKFNFRVVGEGKSRLIWENTHLPWRVKENTVLFSPGYTMPMLFKGKSVVSNLGIYNAFASTFPWWYRARYEWVFRRSARRATVVIANSQSTRHDISRFYGVPPEKIEVVLPGVDERFRPRDVTQELLPLRAELGVGDAPYLLFVGKLSHRRHVPELLAAMELLKQQGLPHHLVIIGPNHLGWDIDGAIAACAARDRIHYRAHMDWSPLSALYAGAELFVLPTQHEGLSFTILEAMASGAGVITLDHAALEGGMREAVAFAPSPSPQDLAQTIREHLEPTRHRALREAGLAASRNFSWHRKARQTLEIIQRVSTLNV